MNKPPAFQFYAKDWLSSTATMSLQVRGAFITWLAWSWDNGPLPDSDEKRARLIGVSRSIERKIWKEIAPLWKATPGGWVNPRLEGERQKQAAFRAEQAEKGRRGGQVAASNRLAAATAPAASRSQPNPSSSSALASSSSVDQEPDQDQRSALNLSSPNDERTDEDPKSGLLGSFTKIRAPSENPAALGKIAIEVRREHPNDPPSEWNAKIRDAAAGARIFYDHASVELAMSRAEHAIMARPR